MNGGLERLEAPRLLAAGQTQVAVWHAFIKAAAPEEPSSNLGLSGHGQISIGKVYPVSSPPEFYPWPAINVTAQITLHQ
jgi:hypothetical protein